MALCEKILICGFSGAGKTDLVKELKLSAPASWELFDDLDEMIFRQYGRGHENLAALIQANGWEKFRIWERQLFEGWLKEEEKGVLALGGGTLSPLLWELYSKSRKLKFCFLDVPFEEAWQRLKKQGMQERPMTLEGKENFRKVFEERLRVFRQIPWKLDATRSTAKLVQEFWGAIGP
jgi:shikimate kinase